MLPQKFLDSFVAFVNGTRVHGYDESGGKDRFKKDSLKILREIAKLMGLPKGSYDVRFNAGGVAVAGDPILHGENIYVNMSQFGGMGFYYRSCNGRKDYTGGYNRWMNWSELKDLNAVVQKFNAAAAASTTLIP